MTADYRFANMGNMHDPHMREDLALVLLEKSYLSSSNVDNDGNTIVRDSTTDILDGQFKSVLESDVGRYLLGGDETTDISIQDDYVAFIQSQIRRAVESAKFPIEEIVSLGICCLLVFLQNEVTGPDPIRFEQYLPKIVVRE